MNRLGSARTALYRVYNDNGELLYVGMSANPDVRFGQHSQTKDWWSTVTERKVEWFNSRKAAADAERVAIRNERPVWNLQLSLTRGVSSDVEALYEAFRRTREELALLLARIKEGAVVEMRDKGATASQLAFHSGLSSEVFRRIARDNNIDRLREPTVGKDAKPKTTQED